MPKSFRFLVRGVEPTKMTLSPDSRRGFFYSVIFRIFVTMRKYTLIFAIIATVAMTACGNESTTSTETTDSTATVADTTVVADSDATQETVDSTVKQ